jgi:glycosyltransferase involved in cell wall biosynthesis
MVIAVNTKLSAADALNDHTNSINEIFRRIIQWHPDHRFIIIADEETENVFSNFNNVIIIQAGHKNIHPSKAFIRQKIAIAPVLKKYKCNLYISYATQPPVRTKVPQCSVVTSLTLIHQSFLIKKNLLLFYKTFFTRNIRKAKSIIAPSLFCKENLSQHFKNIDDRIEIIYSGIAHDFDLVNDQNKDEIKSKYYDGYEYFIYTGEIGSHKNLVTLLKAFSAFKKRQKSSMKLCIAGHEGYKHESFYEELRLFRFKADVKIFKDPPAEQLAQLLAASYAMVFPSKYECFAVQPLQAMKSNVPVIASSKGVMPEILGDAALYADPDNFKEFAVKMMQLFRDETLRKELIAKGKARADKYRWDEAAEKFWNIIERQAV